MSRKNLRFVTRQRCPLCDEARPIVARAARRAKVSVEEVDVDGDPDLLASFGDRVPALLAPDGAVLAEGNIDRRRLREALERLPN